MDCRLNSKKAMSTDRSGVPNVCDSMCTGTCASDQGCQNSNTNSHSSDTSLYTNECKSSVDYTCNNNLKIGSSTYVARMNYPDFVKLVEKFCIVESKVDLLDVFNIPNYTFYSKTRSEQFLR